MENYIRRAAEIQIALICKKLYTFHRNTQALIDFFRANAKILNVPNVEYLEVAVINYKKLLPTMEELVALSDFADSRQKYCQSEIISNYVCRTNFYKILKTAEPAETLLKPITTIQTTNTLIEFLSKFKRLSNIFSDFLIQLYPEYEI